jgi:signal transduction histidine kinase
MDALVRQNLDAMRFQVQKAGATVAAEPLPACLGDARLVSQVLTNLLDNALKYRDPARALHITLSGQVVGEEVVFCVADTGVGIAAEHLERIWELFHRLHPEGPVAGEGLGLNLVQRILSRLSGRTWAESTPGQGSRFFFALPHTGLSTTPIPPLHHAKAEP